MSMVVLGRKGLVVEDVNNFVILLKRFSDTPQEVSLRLNTSSRDSSLKMYIIGGIVGFLASVQDNILHRYKPPLNALQSSEGLCLTYEGWTTTTASKGVESPPAEIATLPPVLEPVNRQLDNINKAVE